MLKSIQTLALSCSHLSPYVRFLPCPMQVQSVNKLKRCYENPFPPDSIRSKFSWFGGGLSVEELSERAAGLQYWLAELLNRSKVEAWGQPTQAVIADFVKAPNQTAEELASAATSPTSLSSLEEPRLLPPPPPPPVEATLLGGASNDASTPTLGRLSLFRKSCLAADDRSLTPLKSTNSGVVVTFEGSYCWRPSRGLLKKFFTKSNNDWRPALWRVAWLSSSKEEAVLLRFDDSGDLSETNGNSASFSSDSGVFTGNESLRIPLRSVRLVEEVHGSGADDEDGEDGMDLSVSTRSMAVVDASSSSGEGTATGSSGHSDDTINSAHGAEDTPERHSIMPAFRSISIARSAASLPKPALFEFVLTLTDGKHVYMAAADAKEREDMVLFLQSTLLRMAYKGRHDDVDLVNAVHQERHQRASQASLPSDFGAGRAFNLHSGSVDRGSRKSNAKYGGWE